MYEFSLTVQSCGKIQEKCKGRYRLYISNAISKGLHDKYKIARGSDVVLDPDGEIIKAKISCGPPLKKGFDIYSGQLNIWLIKNKLCNYEKGQPKKINFTLVSTNPLTLKLKP
jgi:hypothetical protein